jgi:hypothetical protein
VSKRHQSSRRKTYGRRQHEVRERRTRDDLPFDDDQEPGEGSTSLAERFAFLAPSTSSLRFAMGD